MPIHIGTDKHVPWKEKRKKARAAFARPSRKSWYSSYDDSCCCPLPLLFLPLPLLVAGEGEKWRRRWREEGRRARRVTPRLFMILVWGWWVDGKDEGREGVKERRDRTVYTRVHQLIQYIYHTHPSAPTYNIHLYL